jgi:hypothetical protein
MNGLEILFLSVPAALIIVKLALLVLAATWALRGAMERGGLFSTASQAASLSAGAPRGTR